MAARDYSWQDYHQPSTFRTNTDSQSLKWWIGMAVVTSFALHAGLYFAFHDLGLGDYVPRRDRAEQEKLKFRLQQDRAKIREDLVEKVKDPVITQPIEREKPPVNEPLDLTQFKMKVEQKELALTPQVEMPKNITLSKPQSGAAGLPAQLLADIPTTVDQSLTKQLTNLPDKVLKDTPISPDQVRISAQTDDGPPDPTLLRDLVRSASKKGAGGGDGDGFTSLNDLLNYQGPITADKKAMMPTDLLFEYGSAELREGARFSLMQLGGIIAKNSDADISLEGHTDLFGGDDYNMQLSTQRAQSVKDWLATSLHLDVSRLTVTGMGKTKPLVPGGSVDEQKKNRRVEIIIRPRKK